MRSACATPIPQARADSRTSGANPLAKFSTEAQLISAFWELFGQPMSSTWTWLREFNSPCGIADLVAVLPSTGWQKRADLAVVPSRWLYPLKVWPLGQEFRSKEFAARFGVSESCAHGVLSTFARAGYCNHRPAQRLWVKARDPIPIVDSIVAVEAKLRNWRRALYQAVQYSSYAFDSWVVLDGTSLHAASVHIDEFERRGIGLMGLTANGHSEILVEPQGRPPRSQERFWQANGEIARRLFEECAIVSG